MAGLVPTIHFRHRGYPEKDARIKSMAAEFGAPLAFHLSLVLHRSIAQLTNYSTRNRYTGPHRSLFLRGVQRLSHRRFIEDYEDNIDKARLELGKLFRIEEYPSKESLRGRFGLCYRIIPVPDADHFMAKLASDDTDRVKRDIESQIEERPLDGG